MTRRCRVRARPYFKQRPGVSNTGFKCYLFPKDPILQQKWIAWVNCANVAGTIKVSANSGVCSAHFTSENISPEDKKLKDDAVPTIVPEMSPELAFKLGVTRSTEDFIRIKQIKEENTVYHSLPIHLRSARLEEEDYSTALDQPHEYQVQPPAGDTSSTILVQAYSQYSSEPELNILDASDAGLRRILVVPVVELKENMQIRDYDSSTDSCYSDSDRAGNDSVNLEEPSPLILCKADLSTIPEPSQVVTISAPANDGAPVISRIHGPCDFNIVTSSTGTNASNTTVPIISLITSANTSKTLNIHTTGTGTLNTNLKVEKLTVTSSTGNDELSPLTASRENNTCTPEEQKEQLPPMRTKRKAYVRDLSPSDFSTPEKAKISLNMVHDNFLSYQSQKRVMSQKLRRAQKKIQSLQLLLQDKQTT